jgi:hypothetical protein
VIVASLEDTYKTKYIGFGCESITSINERVTVNSEKKGVIPVDAIHGGNYFEITVSLYRVGANEDNVELFLKK